MSHHPLKDFCQNNHTGESHRYEQYIPRYFKQRLALGHLHNSTANQIVEQVRLESETVLNLELSGVNYKDFK